MKSLTTQILLVLLALVFLFKGGLAMLVSAWKLVAAVTLLGGGYYFVKKALSSSGAGLPKRKASPHVGDSASTSGSSSVIEICPYCHSEMGSCPRCGGR